MTNYLVFGSVTVDAADPVADSEETVRGNAAPESNRTLRVLLSLELSVAIANRCCWNQLEYLAYRL